MVIYQSKFAKVEWLANEKIVCLTQNGNNRGQDLKDSLNAGLKCLTDNMATKWLSDNRNLGFHLKEDHEWVNNEWTPQAIKSGWKKWALVQPVSAVSNIDMKKFVDFFSKHGIEVKAFQDYDLALDWLKQN